ncbi:MULTISPECIES: hypothetical protein [Streptomyces]|uniref:Uncharacterized protein n=2 Tax=Streptomyces TaxID=1883 RepID=A0A5P2BMU4_STRVZ|nr:MULTISPECIES: hypothetical protein [Streptomyces]NEA04146.1 hypothetical protein [Streptomyces sp. SID10116]MYY84286.1 hypothetical protein [Streptomyces sp. SID335]NDZ86564.1 hypothetical protein [Streptomyces sp. SID10115]NEB48052.1 hypothetical protein [Streptomyces sp. SID339]QES31782.1 hypothetical protein DEJ47_27195 [Streptomyces venezuelae]
MFEYEMHQMRAAELVRRADHQRLVGEARKSRATARRSARDEAEGPVSTPLRKIRFMRAA